MNQGRLRRYFRHGTLTQLLVFDAVCRTGSYTKAAEDLHFAQPTVSIQMQKLAETVGFRLFRKDGRRMRPTAAGQELWRTCGEIIESLEALESRLGLLPEPGGGNLVIAAACQG
jgi:DNA-binding transcriptional LysR family regulator